MQTRAKLDNPCKNGQPMTSGKWLNVSVIWACQAIHSKMKDKLLHIKPPIVKKAKTLVDLCGFSRQHTPHLRLLLWHSLRVTHKASSFKWNRAKLRLCSKLSLIQETQWYLRYPWQVEDTVHTLWASTNSPSTAQTSRVWEWIYALFWG